ncbi:MAG: hypothetical protein LBV26_09250 [Bacteroidales bacterium]|jgi:hypothetical protein|nr:hypothetical protein [Bacteroidales bacterium]
MTNKFFINRKVGVISIIVAILAGVIVGCKKESFGMNYEVSGLKLKSNSRVLAPNEFEYFGEIVKCQEGELIWEKQLSLIIEDNLLKDDGLTLNSYRYVRKINSIDELEKIKSAIISNAILPYHSSESLELIKREDISNELKPVLDSLKPILDSLIPVSKYYVIDRTTTGRQPFQCLFEAGDMSTVELEWTYRGEKINTTALVSEKKGIVYDHLLYFVIPVKNKKKNTDASKTVVHATPRLKSGSENTDGSFNFIFSHSGYAYNAFGMLIWEFEVHCEIPYKKTNGAVSINGCNNMHKESYAALGFSCVADIRKKGIVTGVNGYVDFAWAYGYGTLVSIAIGWNGSGFTVSGGGTHRSGEEYVNSHYLGM